MTGPDLVRVVLTGSESVGKTTLAARLAAHYGVLAVPEFVREYVAGMAEPLGEADHGPIARGQMAREDAYRARAIAAGHRLLIQDTDLVSTMVYCRHYVGHCPDVIAAAARTRVPALYLLLDIDVPWVADGVRDRGDRRAELQQGFRDALASLTTPVQVVRGSWEQRFHAAVRHIDALVTSPS